MTVAVEPSKTLRPEEIVRVELMVSSEQIQLIRFFWFHAEEIVRDLS